MAIKELEVMLPISTSAKVDQRQTTQRSFDSQTVFRLTIAHFRTKLVLQGSNRPTS